MTTGDVHIYSIQVSNGGTKRVCRKSDLLDSVPNGSVPSDQVPTEDVTPNCTDNAKECDFKDLDTGWAWVILVATFCAFCLFGSTLFAVGIIHSALLDKYGQSVSLTSWAGAIHSSLFWLGGPFSTVIVDRFSCRTAIMLSGMLFMLGFVSTAFAPSIEVAIFTCGIIAGMGGGVGYTAGLIVISLNFKRRRNLALGIANAGVGAGMFAFAPLEQLAYDTYGSVGFFLILAGCMSNLVVFGALCFPSRLERHTQYQRRKEHEKPSGKRTFAVINLIRSYGNALLNKGIVCICLSKLLFYLGVNSMYLHLPTYIRLNGFTAVQASFLISLSGILSSIGRLLSGAIANWKVVKEIILYSGSMALIAIPTFVYPFLSSYFEAHATYAAILGLFLGPSIVVSANISEQFVGINFLSAALGVEALIGGVGALTGPVLAGYMVDNGGTYDQSIYVSAACVLTAAVLGGISMCFSNVTKVKSTNKKSPTEMEMDPAGPEITHF